MMSRSPFRSSNRIESRLSNSSGDRSAALIRSLAAKAITALIGLALIWILLPNRSVPNPAPTPTPTPIPTPLAPSILIVSGVSPAQINLGWQDNSSDETGFKIERSLNGSSWAQIATVGANVKTYSNNTGLTESVRYHYQVRAYNGGGDSGYSNAPSDWTWPATPTGLAAVTISASQISLSWTDNSSGENGTRIYRKTGPASFAQIFIVSTDVTTFQDTTPEEATTYTYMVRAYNTSHNSANSNESAATTAPDAPTNFAAEGTSPTQIDLTWSDNSSGETGFRIERSPNGTSGWTQIATPAANATSHPDTGRTEATRYYYRIVAVGSGGDSAIDSADDWTSPNAPTNLVSQSVSDTRIDLSWTDISAGETGVKIERDAGSGFTQIATVASPTTTYQNTTGLSADAPYTYRVRSYVSGGGSSSDSTYATGIEKTTYLASSYGIGPLGSASGGSMFEPVAYLNTDAPTDAMSGDADLDEYVRVAADGNGVWVAVWSRIIVDNPGNPSHDNEIYFSRSVNDGVDWSAPVLLDADMASNDDDLSYHVDEAPDIRTDGDGNWMIVWSSTYDFTPPDGVDADIGIDNDIVYSVSSDDAATWSSVMPLTPVFSAGQLAGNFVPIVRSAGNGRWLVAWATCPVNDPPNDPLGIGDHQLEYDLLYTISTDDGQTWIDPPLLLNTNAATDTEDDLRPRIETDGNGGWVAVWYGKEDVGGAGGDDYDILYSRSVNRGLAWSAPLPLNNHFTGSESAADGFPQIATNERGDWVVAFITKPTEASPEFDVEVLRSEDNGATWIGVGSSTIPIDIHSVAGNDIWPRLETDRNDNWILAWQSNGPTIGGHEIGSDYDILVSYSTDNGATWATAEPANTNANLDTGDDQFVHLATDTKGEWLFGWQSDDDLANTNGVDMVGTDLDIFKTMTSVNISARTLFVETYPLTGILVDFSPGGPSATSNFSRNYAIGTDVTVQTPPDELGASFDRWFLDSVEPPNSQSFITVTMDRTHTLIASYGSGPPVVSIAATSGNVNEGSNIAVDIELSDPFGFEIRVDYRTFDISATAGEDYTAFAPATSTLIFAKGETTKQVTVTTLQDSMDENDEVFCFNIFNPVGAALGVDTKQIRILDDDAAPSVVLASATQTALESDGRAMVKAQLSAASERIIVVECLTTDGTAVEGVDYRAVLGTITFPPGLTEVDLSIPLIIDYVAMTTNTFTMEILAPIHAMLGATTEQTITIAQAAEPPPIGPLDDDKMTSVPIVMFTVMPELRTTTTTLTFEGSVTSGYAIDSLLCTVRDDATGDLVTGLEDTAGDPLTNPFTPQSIDPALSTDPLETTFTLSVVVPAVMGQAFRVGVEATNDNGGAGGEQGTISCTERADLYVANPFPVDPLGTPLPDGEITAFFSTVPTDSVDIGIPRTTGVPEQTEPRFVESLRGGSLVFVTRSDRELDGGGNPIGLARVNIIETDDNTLDTDPDDDPETTFNFLEVLPNPRKMVATSDDERIYVAIQGENRNDVTPEDTEDINVNPGEIGETGEIPNQTFGVPEDAWRGVQIIERDDNDPAKWVTNAIETNSVLKIKLPDNALDGLATDSQPLHAPADLVIDYKKNRLYIASWTPNLAGVTLGLSCFPNSGADLFVVNTLTDLLVSAETVADVGDDIFGIEMGPNGLLYLLDSPSNVILVVSTASGERVKTIGNPIQGQFDLFNRPVDLSITADGRHAAVLNGGISGTFSESITLVKIMPPTAEADETPGPSQPVVNILPLDAGSRPRAIETLGRDRSIAYVSQEGSGDLRRINLTVNGLEFEAPVAGEDLDGSPQGMAALPEPFSPRFEDRIEQVGLALYTAESFADSPGAVFADLVDFTKLAASAGGPDSPDEVDDKLPNNDGMDGYPDLLLLAGDDVVTEAPDPQTNIGDRRIQLWINKQDGTFMLVDDPNLFLNLGNVSNTDFTDTTGGPYGASAGDYDNDGDLDIYLTTSCGDINFLFENKAVDESSPGQAVFVDVTLDAFDPDKNYRLVGDDTQPNTVPANPCLPAGDPEASEPDFSLNPFVSAHSFASLWADVDRDGYLDLYVSYFRRGDQRHPSNIGWPNHLYQNNGDGTFTDITVASGNVFGGGAHGSSPLALMAVDFNNDRWPDIYVANDNPSEANTEILHSELASPTLTQTELNEFVPTLNDPYFPAVGTSTRRSDALYLSHPTTGAIPAFDVFDDIIHLSGDDGTILGNDAYANMGVDAADVDNDGDLDFYSTDILSSLYGAVFQPPVGSLIGGTLINFYYENRFEENAQAGADPTFRKNTYVVENDLEPGNEDASDLNAGFSWGTVFADFDNDGDEDLFVAGDGRVTFVPSVVFRNELFVDNERNSGSIPRFLNVKFRAGVGGIKRPIVVPLAGIIQRAPDNHAAVTGDFNRDGKIDIFAGYKRHQISSFFVNVSETEDQAWLQLLLEGVTYDTAVVSPTSYKSTRDAVGARIELFADLDDDGSIELNQLIGESFSPASSPFAESLTLGTGGERQIREVVAGHSNAATSDLTVHFGLGPARRVYVTIKWPSGIIQTWPGAAAAYTAVDDVTEIVSDEGMIFDIEPTGDEQSINAFHLIRERIVSP